MNMNNLDPFNMEDRQTLHELNVLFSQDRRPTGHAPADGGGAIVAVLRLIPVLFTLGFKLVKGIFHIMQAIHRHR